MTSFSMHAKYLNEKTIGYIKEGNRSNFLVLDKDLNIKKFF
jgi:N-acetylglucosamine-6-phosphate deacetylase